MRKLIWQGPEKIPQAETIVPKERKLIELHPNSENIIHSSFVYLVLGLPGSGKTTFV